MEKENYTELELEIIRFETEDVLVTSCTPDVNCPLELPIQSS